MHFCAERHYAPLPATPVVVQAFIEASFSGKQPRSVATVERYLSTIAHAHALSDLPDPTKTAHVKSAFRHLARGKPSSQPKAALRGSHITYALGHLQTDHVEWDLRAKALLSTAYCTMARRAELVALRVADLSFNTDSRDGVALIRNTKAGREESRYLSTEAVLWLKAWLGHAQIKEGSVFRRFTPRGTIGQRAIAPQEVARIIQRVGRVLNGPSCDTNACWNDPKMPRYYTRELAAQESGMARMMRALREKNNP